MPDAYASQMVRIYLQYEGDMEEVKIVDGVYKPSGISCGSHAYYMISYPINAFKVIKKCKIETWGYGGQVSS